MGTAIGLWCSSCLSQFIMSNEETSKSRNGLLTEYILGICLLNNFCDSETPRLLSVSWTRFTLKKVI